MSNTEDKYVGIKAFGAEVGIHVDGLDKPVRAIGRGLARILGFSRKNVHKAAKAIAAKTE